MALAALVVIGFLTGVAGVVYLQRLAGENDRLYFTVRKQQKELTKAQALIDKLKTERDTLIEGRIPGLQKLAYDQTFDLGEGYVRNIIFTLTRADGQNNYEYKAVLDNRTSDVISPNVHVRLYDELGVQVGAAQIGSVRSDRPQNGTDAAEEVLKPDEIRSYSDSLNVVEGADPLYFSVLAR